MGGEYDARTARILDDLARDVVTTRRRLWEMVETGRLTETALCARVLRDLAEETGRRWERREWTVAHEHLVTAAIEEMLGLIGANPVEVPKGVVAAACAEGEWHALPSRMLAAVLRGRGWRVHVLGPSVPIDEMSTFLNDVPVEALLLSCTVPGNLPGAARSIARAHEIGVPVFVGGRAFGADHTRAARLGADGWAPSAEACEQLLDNWRPPLQVVPPAPEAAVELARVSGLVGDAWRARLHAEDRFTAGELAWFEQVLPGVLLAVEAAILVDDHRILYDEMRWLRRATAARVEAPHAVELLVECLLRVLPPAIVEVHRLLGDAVALTRAASAGRATATPDDQRALRLHPAVRTGRQAAFDDLALVAAAAGSVPSACIALFDGPDIVVKGLHGGDLADARALAGVGAQHVAAQARGDLPDAAGVAAIELRLDDTIVGVLVLGGTTTAALDPVGRRALHSIARQVEAMLFRTSGKGDDLVRSADLSEVPVAELRAALLAAGEAALDDLLLRASDVARLFNVTTRTVANWSDEGRLDAVLTPGRQRRYRAASVVELLRGAGHFDA